MRWRGRRRSTNVEDRRGRPPGGALLGGGLGMIAVVVIVLLLGGDPSQILQQGGGQPGGQAEYVPSPGQEELVDFVKVVLADTEDVWRRLFRENGKTYEDAKLVLFTGRVPSACGMASAAMGPFYCPPDGSVYIDLEFYEQMKQRFDIPGDFAQAYVIAHEVGHHVQNLLGISDRVHGEQQRVGKVEANRLSVRLELQADFLAGVWAHHADRAHQVLEEGDIEEALNAASRIGDDAIQRRTQGHVVPDSFTHGTSAQRVTWFRHGLRTGDLKEGNTFDEATFRRIDPVGR